MQKDDVKQIIEDLIIIPNTNIYETKEALQILIRRALKVFLSYQKQNNILQQVFITKYLNQPTFD